MSQTTFKGSHFPKDVILQAVFWYLRYSLSYRDIEELMKERGVEVDHSTIQRWVVKYTPMLENEVGKRKKRDKKSARTLRFAMLSISTTSWNRIIERSSES